MILEAPSVGAAGFIAGLAAQNISCEELGGLVVYRVVPLDGASAGVEVETGVEAAELAGWSRTPPHWIHVPDSLTIPGGSQNASERSGWSRYSRPHPGRLDAASNPAREWVAHVRWLLGTAT
jgi:hypothetical protein